MGAQPSAPRREEIDGAVAIALSCARRPNRRPDRRSRSDRSANSPLPSTPGIIPSSASIATGSIGSEKRHIRTRFPLSVITAPILRSATARPARRPTRAAPRARRPARGQHLDRYGEVDPQVLDELAFVGDDHDALARRRRRSSPRAAHRPRPSRGGVPGRPRPRRRSSRSRRGRQIWGRSSSEAECRPLALELGLRARRHADRRCRSTRRRAARRCDGSPRRRWNRCPCRPSCCCST